MDGTKTLFMSVLNNDNIKYIYNYGQRLPLLFIKNVWTLFSVIDSANGALLF